MTTELTVERRAEALLHERAVRQALVDRLAGDSIWGRLVTGLVAPIVAGAIFLLISSLWVDEGSRFAESVVAGALTGVLWLAIGLAQLASVLRHCAGEDAATLLPRMRMWCVLEAVAWALRKKPHHEEMKR